MSVRKCLLGKVESGLLTKDQMGEIEDRLTRYEQKNRRGMNQEQADALAAKQAMEAFTKEKARKARQTKLGLSRQANLLTSKDQYGGDGYRWLLSELDIDPWARNADAPASNLQEIHRNRALSMMNDLLAKYRPRLAGIKRPRAGMDDVVRELHGQKTGVETAAELAEGFRAAAKYLWTEFNRFAGDTIAWRDDWAMPHLHDPVRLGSVAPDQWIDDIMPMLNREKMLDFDTNTPLSDAELRTLLRDTYETIRTHGMTDKTPGTAGGRAIGNRHSDARMLQFKDGDSWLSYSQKYGAGDPFETMLAYVDSMSRDIGLMEKFGPNPKAMVQTLKDTIAIEEARKPVAGGKKAWRGKQAQNTRARAVDNTYAVLTGSTSIPVNGFGAGMMSMTRSVLAGVLLQRAFLSSMTDVNTQRIARRMIGLPQAKALTNFVRNLKGALKEDQQLALHLSLGSESWTQTASGLARYTGDVTGPEWSKRFADTTMRATLLTPWTQGGKNTFGLDFYNYLHRVSAKSFDQLPDELKFEFSRFGISEEYWNVIRKTDPHEAGNGAKYVNPLNVFGADDKLAREAATRLQNMQLTLQQIAVPEVTARVRAGVMGESKPGTIIGEMARSVGLFKNFPLTMLHMHLFNTVQSRAGRMNKAKMAANVVIGSAVFGGLAFQIKEIQQGRDPMDMTQPAFWVAALAQGGGLGLFGDFVFADQNRFGKGWWTSLSGPVMDLFDDLTKLTVGNVQEAMKGKKTNIGKESANFAGKYLPGGKFWYWGLAFQRNVLDQLDLATDPKAYKRQRQQEEKYWKERKQRYWWKPGTSSPQRAPDVGAVLGQ